MSRSQAFWILLAIILLGIGIRSYELPVRSLWFDEAFSWRLASFPLPELIARDATDVHPPLYYILLKGWGTVFGFSLIALRSFSVACAGIALASAYLYAAYAFRSRRAGMIAALFLAVSPWCISYAWEARMYPLGMVFTLLSSYALLHAVRDRSLKWFGVYGLLAALFAYTHYYAFFTIAAHGVFVLTVLVRSTKWRIGEMVQAKVFWGGVLSLGIALLLFSPWLSTFLQQRSQVQASFWIPPVSISGISNTFYQFFIPTLSIPRLYGVSAIPFFLTFLLYIYAIVRYRKSDGVWLTLLAGGVPLIISILISLGGRSLYNDRFFAFAGIFLFILIAHSISDIRKPLVRRALVSLAVLGLVATFVLYWNELDIANKAGAHGAATYVFTQRTNEPVFVSSPFVYFAILHYAEEEFHAMDAVRLYEKEGLAHFSGAPIITSRDIARATDIADVKGVVWVIDTTGFTQQPFVQPSNWREESRTVFPEVFVYQGDIIVRKFFVK